MMGCEDLKTKKNKANTYYKNVEQCLSIKENNPSNYFRLMVDCMIGSELPAFEVESLDGKKISKEGLKGKMTIINFWFTTCPPCVAEIPGFATIIERYGKDNINYIAVGDNSQLEISEFLQTHPWDFIHISNENDIIEKIFKVELFGYPTTYLLNEEAQIVKSFSGGKSGDSATSVLLNKLIPAIESELKQ